MCTQDGDVEYFTTYRNEYGNGFDLTVSTPLDGMVDVVIYQSIAHTLPEEPSCTLTLPIAAASAMVNALYSGTRDAAERERLKKMN